MSRDDPRDSLKLTKKYRLKLLANLIADKMIEDGKQGRPLLKQILADMEEGKKKKSKGDKS
jgi:hypothetical protein